VRRPRRRRLKGLPFNRMIPNILTLLALCAGLTAIRFGLQEQWEYAVLAIMVAGIFDTLDGRVARLLKGASRFGAELDSLSDFVCFGVAPMVLHYLWSMKDAGRIGWAVALLFCVCCGLRLARFNTLLDEPDAWPWTYKFFTGVPAPAGAGVVLLPMVLTFQIGTGFFDRPEVVGVFLVLAAGLLVSRVPTFSFKKFKVPNHLVLPTMLIVGLIAASMVSAPWATTSALLIAYLFSIPFSVRAYRRLEKVSLAARAEAEEEPAPVTLEIVATSEDP
jgi:CDP-diacylglycerol---serine O-phosphatidyltransferase